MYTEQIRGVVLITVAGSPDDYGLLVVACREHYNEAVKALGSRIRDAWLNGDIVGEDGLLRFEFSDETLHQVFEAVSVSPDCVSLREGLANCIAELKEDQEGLDAFIEEGF